MSWTADVRLFAGYDAIDPRPPLARALDLAKEVAAGHGTVGLELSLGTQAADRMVGEPDDVHGRVVRCVRRRARRNAARRGARSSPGRRSNGCGRERDRGGGDGALQAGDRARHERGADSGGVGGVRARRGDGLGGAGRPGARLLPRLVWPRHQDVHGDDLPAPSSTESRRCSRSGSARTGTGATTKNLVAGVSRSRTASSRPDSWRCTGTLAAFSPAGGEPGELDCRIRAHRRAGLSGQPSHPVCHGVGARAHEPLHAHQAGGGEIVKGMVLAIEPGCYMEGGNFRVEDNFLITADGAEKLAVSRWDSPRDPRPLEALDRST